MFYYFGPIDYYEFMQHQIYHHLFVYHFDNCLRNTLLPEKRFCHIHTDILTRVSSGAPDILVYWYKKNSGKSLYQYKPVYRLSVVCTGISGIKLGYTVGNPIHIHTDILTSPVLGIKPHISVNRSIDMH